MNDSVVLIEQLIKVRMKDLGFSRQRRNYYFQCEKLVLLVNFQSSTFSSLFFVNICAHRGDLNEIGRLPEYKFEFRSRIDSYLSKKDELVIMPAFDFENNMTVNDRIEVVDNSFFEIIESLKGIFFNVCTLVDYINIYRPKRLVIIPDMMDYLKLNGLIIKSLC